MSENIMNTTATMNRPVTKMDIAKVLNIPYGTVCAYLAKNSTASCTPGSKVELVRKTAQEMGYDPDAALKWNSQNVGERAKKAAKEREGVCPVCGKVFRKNSCPQKYCSTSCKDANRKEYIREYMHEYMKEHKKHAYWYNGNFKTHEEEIARMKELRAKGYSNPEIAKAIGRSKGTVLHAIGKQDRELWKQNVAMAAHIRAQKNAARKQYVVNKPIREYNRKVEEHNRMKAEVAKMEAELKPQTPMIQQAAQTKITFPIMNMETIRPTALQ